MLRGIGAVGRISIAAMGVVALMVAGLALASGWWLHALLAVMLGALLVLTAPTALRGRRTAPTAGSSRRPVVRRRRRGS